MADLAIDKTHIILVDAVVKKVDKILISQRSWQESHKPGKWTIPGGEVEQSDKEIQSVHRKNSLERFLKRRELNIKKK